jgi:hypothetical protein
MVASIAYPKADGTRSVPATVSGSALHHFAMQTWSTGIDMAEVRGGGIWRRPDSPATTQADNLFHMEAPAEV